MEAPQTNIGTSVVLRHRLDFARWLYQRLTARQKAALKARYSAAPANIGQVLWPVMQEYLRAHHADSCERAQLLMEMASMTAPHNWFLLAKSLPRRVIYHSGPTNSGKTWQALQALRSAEQGVYCAPLRLLAAEVATKMNSEGLPCSLVTGQERDVRTGAMHVACTTEMASTGQVYDVAVIDEIQVRHRCWLCGHDVGHCGHIVAQTCGRPVEFASRQSSSWCHQSRQQVTMPAVWTAVSQFGGCVHVRAQQYAHCLGVCADAHLLCSSSKTISGAGPGRGPCWAWLLPKYMYAVTLPVCPSSRACVPAPASILSSRPMSG